MQCNHNVNCPIWRAVYRLDCLYNYKYMYVRRAIYARRDAAQTFFFYKTLQIIVKSIQLQNDESDECPVGAACRAQLFIYARVIVLTAISSCIFRPDPPGFHPISIFRFVTFVISTTFRSVITRPDSAEIAGRIMAETVGRGLKLAKRTPRACYCLSI